jgi:hypothetical protein
MLAFPKSFIFEFDGTPNNVSKPEEAFACFLVPFSRLLRLLDRLLEVECLSERAGALETLRPLLLFLELLREPLFLPTSASLSANVSNTLGFFSFGSG